MKNRRKEHPQQDLFWLETLISKQLRVRVSINTEAGYWYAYNPLFGHQKVSDLLQGRCNPYEYHTGEIDRRDNGITE